MAGLNKKNMKNIRRKQRNTLRRKMQRIITTMVGHRVIIVGFCERMAYPEERKRLSVNWGVSIYYIDTRDLKEKYIFFLKGSPIYETLSRICLGSWLFWYPDKEYFIVNKRKRIFGYANRL